MRIKNLIYCALITLIALRTPALADNNIVSDANNDGIITTVDSLLALQMSVGSIDGTEVPVDMYRFIDSDTIRAIFNLPGTTSVSGSGLLATIHFTVTGTVGDTSVLDISDGLLVDTGSDEIPSTWIDDEVTV